MVARVNGHRDPTSRSAEMISNASTHRASPSRHSQYMQQEEEPPLRHPVTTASGGALWWTREQAQALATSQLSPSGCGPTAAVDVLQLLGLPADPSAVQDAAPARLRDYDAPLMNYLLSRARAGTTHLDLLAAVDQLSRGHVLGAFFSPHHLTPAATLGAWLRDWVAAGAVPVLTMNLFLQGNDAWHHQVVYGVEPPTQPTGGLGGPEGSAAGLGTGQSWQVLLLNPLSQQPAERLVHVLTTPPFMIIPRDHVERKLLDLLLGRAGPSSAAGRAVGQGDEENGRGHSLDAVLELCRHLQATPPWADFAVGEQLTAILHRLLFRHATDHDEGDNAKDPSACLLAGERSTARGSTAEAMSTEEDVDTAATTAGEVRATTAGITACNRSGVASGTAGHSRFGDLVIPWGGLAGVTLFARRASSAARWLQLRGAAAATGARNPEQGPATSTGQGGQPEAPAENGRLGHLTATPFTGGHTAGAMSMVLQVPLPLYPGTVAQVYLDLCPPC